MNNLILVRIRSLFWAFFFSFVIICASLNPLMDLILNRNQHMLIPNVIILIFASILFCLVLIKTLPGIINKVSKIEGIIEKKYWKFGSTGKTSFTTYYIDINQSTFLLTFEQSESISLGDHVEIQFIKPFLPFNSIYEAIFLNKI